ncbi:MAG: isopentenyl-diphosphate Delta-isomerase [Bacteroidota bacterium]
MIEKDEYVILIDEDDEVIGTMEKMEAHLKGHLHRAFSVFIFNTKGQLLLQQRATHKYHSGGKWTNTCCSHPRPGEDTFAAANRRLAEEMGLQCTLHPVFTFTYRATVEEGLIEHEYDHVFFGVSDELPVTDADEVAAYRYLDMASLELDLKAKPSAYTEWLKICFDRVKNNYHQYFKGRLLS